MWYKITIMKKLKAQQLIEFLFVVPFLVIILGIVTEYAYALNVNMSISHGLRATTSTLYASIKPTDNMTELQIQNQICSLVKDKMYGYLSINNIPNEDENAFKVQCAVAGDNAAFVAQYTYVPTITLPLVYIHILPEQIHFAAASVVPTAFLKPNNYSSMVMEDLVKVPTGIQLGYGFWSFQMSQQEKSILKQSLYSMGKGTEDMIFLVPVTVPYPPFNSSGDTYYVVDWAGNIVGGYNWFGSLGPSDSPPYPLYLCSPPEDKPEEPISCYPAVDRSVQYLLDKHSIVYVFDKSDYQVNYGDCSSTSSCVNWLNGSSPIWASSGGLLYALTFSSNGGGGAYKNHGNYDGIKVNTYNSYAAGDNIYKMETNGSYVFVHGKDSVPNLFGGSGIYFGGNKEQHFGTEFSE